MLLRCLRVVVGLLLGASGALMFAASWQRWTSVVCVNVPANRQCRGLEDHYYDFIPPLPRWEQLGNGAQLAGCSLLLLTVAFVLLPWAVTGRRPGLVTAVVLLVAVLAQAAVGVATLLSGLADRVVEPVFIGVTLNAWLLVPFGLLVWFAIEARGWPRAATVALILANPFVAFFTYRAGSYDSRPWYEAISGSFIAAAGVCLLLAAAFQGRSRTPESADPGTSTAAAPGPATTTAAPPSS